MFNYVEEIEDKWRSLGIDVLLIETEENIHLGMLIVTKRKRCQGIGTSFMNDLTTFADSVGKIISVTPDEEYGGTLSRLETFYKRFSFVENKSENKKFNIKQSYLRFPQ